MHVRGCSAMATPMAEALALAADVNVTLIDCVCSLVRHNRMCDAIAL
jgi:hypothetical protein